MLLLGFASGTAFAQVTPAAAITPPDDTPSIRVGATLFTDYTYTLNPQTTDADGNLINANAFNVARAYLNITGNISHIVAFRITPDVARETSATSSLSGSLEFRIKYAYLQTNLDDWLWKGSYARFGIQQTPWLDFIEGIYRYRFQGAMFAEREGYFASADAGAAFHTNLPKNYGDIQVGVFNGENYQKAEANDQKAIMVRGTVRPFATGDPMLRGLRATLFYDGDNYIRNAERTRFIGSLTYEHPSLTLGLEYLKAHDQVSVKVGTPDVESSGFSVWAIPKSPSGWEGLLRFDHLTPNASVNGARNRTIAGIAYWFPHQGAVTSALMLDYDGQTFDSFATAQPAQKRLAVHALISF